MCANPFNFPGWVLTIAWLGLIIDLIMEIVKGINWMMKK
jgi:hypothetical protein